MQIYTEEEKSQLDFKIPDDEEIMRQILKKYPDLIPFAGAHASFTAPSRQYACDCTHDYSTTDIICNSFPS